MLCDGNMGEKEKRAPLLLSLLFESKFAGECLALVVASAVVVVAPLIVKP